MEKVIGGGGWVHFLPKAFIGFHASPQLPATTCTTPSAWPISYSRPRLIPSLSLISNIDTKSAWQKQSGYGVVGQGGTGSTGMYPGRAAMGTLAPPSISKERLHAHHPHPIMQGDSSKNDSSCLGRQALPCMHDNVSDFNTLPPPKSSPPGGRAWRGDERRLGGHTRETPHPTAALHALHSCPCACLCAALFSFTPPAIKTFTLSSPLPGVPFLNSIPLIQCILSMIVYSLFSHSHFPYIKRVTKSFHSFLYFFHT